MEIALVIGAAVTLCVLAAAAVETIPKLLKHRERIAEINASRPHSSAAPSSIESLTAEISRLRDTTTQHAMSLQTSLDEMQHRLDVVEAKTRATHTTPELPEQQRVAGGR